MIRRPPISTRTHTLSLHDALPIYESGLKDLIRSFVPPAEAAARLPVASLSAPPPVSRKFGPLRLFKRLMPREDGFFELFARHAETVVGGADALGAMFAGEAGIEEHCRRIAEFENQADTVTRHVPHALRRRDERREGKQGVR